VNENEFAVSAGDDSNCISDDEANHPDLRRDEKTVKHCLSFIETGEFAKE
jgi:hypothetical protein